jgi:RNA polymerase sigma-B factor
MGVPARDSRSGTIEAHLPLVRSIARRYASRGEPLEDLVQIGTVGLIKAVDRYDPKRHADLAAFARPAIEGEIRHHLRDAGAGPHVPRTDRELAGRVWAAAGALEARLRRRPTVGEVAAAAGVDEAAAERALHVQEVGRAVPLDDEAEPSPSAARADDTEAAEARVLLAAGWSMLDERERRMLELRYRDDRSQAEIARELGLSQAHVSRLLRGALARLREALDPAAAPEPGAGATAPPPAAKDIGRNGRLLLRLPRSLHHQLAQAAEREGVPLNTYITGTLAAAVADDDEPAPPPARRARRLLVLNAVVIALAALTGVALLLQALLGS